MVWNDDTEQSVGVIRDEKYGKVTRTYVDIVRCKDCRRYYANGGNCDQVLADWFCADGEKEGGEVE